jgi:hypothetical protein
MSIWILLLIICVAGAVGGVVNALMTNNGFVMPQRESTDVGSILRPGFFGNIIIGAIAAGISWGLYGPLANNVVFGAAALTKNSEGAGISVSALVGAVLVGIGGARWLTNEVDKNLLKAAAAKAAGAHPDPKAGEKIAVARPVDALRIAKGLPRP